MTSIELLECVILSQYVGNMEEKHVRVNICLRSCILAAGKCNNGGLVHVQSFGRASREGQDGEQDQEQE